MGMPITRTRANRNRVIGMLRFYAGMATALNGETIDNSWPAMSFPTPAASRWASSAPSSPGNAPAAASVWKIGPALATGCTVVLKPSEEAPLTRS